MASVKWTAADLPDQSGRTAVVTGASSGIGLVAARELARAGARVVLAVRDPEKGKRVAAGIPGDTQVRPLDLASLASVRVFAAGWTGALDILVNNADRGTAAPTDRSPQPGAGCDCPSRYRQDQLGEPGQGLKGDQPVSRGLREDER